jgi:hypothetical protein
MSEPSHHTAPDRRSIAPAIIGILLAVGAIALMYFSFVNGISAALNGSDGDSALFIALFFIGAAVAVIAAVIGIVGLVRGGHRILAALTVLIALIPGVAIVLLRLANS